MKRFFSITLSIIVLVMTGCGNPPQVASDLRAPAYPLITIDPYTSAWSGADNLYDRQVMHWTEKDFPLLGVIKVDGKPYRFMGIEDANKLKVSRRVASIWVVISMGIAVLIGVAGFSLLKEGIIGPYEPDPTADNLLKSLISDAETIIVDIASYLSNFGIIPSITAGIILAGILASTMSTADSQLLAASSSISQNLLVETFHIKMNEKTNMWIARFAVIEVSLIAVLLAMNPDSSVFEIVSFAWAGFGAAFGPIMLCALFWKRTTLPGAIAGMITGGAMVFIWKFLIAKLGDAFAIYELLPAFVLALIVTVVVSLCTKAPSKEITDAFDDVQKSVKAKN